MSEANKHSGRLRGGVVLAACSVVGAAWSALAIYRGHAINDPIGGYVLYQLVTGILAGILAPQWLWAAWIGAIAGQGFALLLVRGFSSTSTASLAIVFIPIFCLPSLVAGAIGAAVNRPRTGSS